MSHPKLRHALFSSPSYTAMPLKSHNVPKLHREVKDKLTEKCKEEVTRTQIDASKDFKVDAMLNELCTADAEALCEGVPNKDGKVQECLRGKRAQLSWDCQEELFRQEVS